MIKNLVRYTIILVILAGCKPDVIKYTINGSIKGGAGKYIKIIDMTRPGLPHDSIQLDMGGKFTFEKVSNQPGDYIFYFKNADYIRVTPLPKETVLITGKANNLIESHTITGSIESEQVSKIIKMHHKTVQIIDTLNQFYMKNQMHPGLDSIVNRLTFIGDSVYNKEKKDLENFIRKNPGTIASYIALSQKVGENINLFTLQNDLQYFEMVDTALQNRFDTIDIVKMISAYVYHGKQKLKTNNKSKKQSLIGKQALEISLPNVYGDTLTLSSLKGKYVLVDFWGSWCRPCRKENPNLRKAYRTYRRKGFEIFQVAIERNKTDWKNTIREDKLYWRYQVSELNYMDSKTAKAYGVKAIPSNYLVNPDGEIIAQNIYGENLLLKLSEIFAPKPISIEKNGE